MQTKKKDTHQIEPSTQEVLTREEVAKRLGVSTATVVRAEEQGIFAGIRLNGPRSSVRYIWQDVIEGLRNSSRRVYVD